MAPGAATWGSVFRWAQGPPPRCGGPDAVGLPVLDMVGEYRTHAVTAPIDQLSTLRSRTAIAVAVVVDGLGDGDDPPAGRGRVGE
jgi:hypothetical protein